MLILNAHNVTENGEHSDGTAEYEVWVGVNGRAIWQGSIRGHVRRGGAAALLYLIAKEMERTPREPHRLFGYVPPPDPELLAALERDRAHNQNLDDAEEEYLRTKSQATTVEDYCRKCGRCIGEGDPATLCPYCSSSHLGHAHGPTHPSLPSFDTDADSGKVAERLGRGEER
jgi:hypothetical protein